MAVETISTSTQNGWHVVVDHDDVAGSIAATVLQQQSQQGTLTITASVVALPALTVLLTIPPTDVHGFVGRTVLATNAALVGITMVSTAKPSTAPFGLDLTLGFQGA